MMRKVAAVIGSRAGSTSRRQLRQGSRPKLAPISVSSASRASRPSRRLTMAKGSSTATMENTTLRLDTPNQMTASRVQPIPEKALKNGLMRWWMAGALQRA